MSGIEGPARPGGRYAVDRWVMRTAGELALWAAAGAGLFFALRLAEQALPDSLLLAALVEEAAKAALFVAAAVSRRHSRRERAEELLRPFFAVAAFGVTENILYYLRYPTSAIYGRLVCSYPIHLNTALLFAVVLGSRGGLPAARRALACAAAFAGAVAYHALFNRLSVLVPRLAPYALGPVNLVLFAALLWRQRTHCLPRSTRHADG
jgi:RsiW-degrading membrane proteinase PrsW (M82 family)